MGSTVSKGDAVHIAIIGNPGPSLPVSIRGARQRALEARGPGHADPDHVTRFTTKRRKPVAPDAPLAQPKGAAKVLSDFVDRATGTYTPEQEWQYIAATQHMEMPTTLATFLANGIEAQSLRSANGAELNIAEGDARTTAYAVRLEDEVIEPDEPTRFLMNLFGMPDGPVRVPRYGDLVYIAAMQRRIEWEQAQDGCVDFEKAAFAVTRDGGLGITYHGWRHEQDDITGAKRLLKQTWLDKFGSLPSVEDIETNKAFAKHYKRPALALLTDAQYAELCESRKTGNEDPDPLRAGHHAEPRPRPHRGQYANGDHRRCSTDVHRNCSVAGDELFAEDTERWERNEKLLGIEGYAGPKGWLGLDDDDSIEDDDEFENPEE